MPLLTWKNGKPVLLIIERPRNANADMSDVKSAHKPKFIVDMSSVLKRDLNRLDRLQARIERRKQLNNMRKMK
jgi:hypothetical protein